MKRLVVVLGALAAIGGCKAVQDALAGMDKPTARVTGVHFAGLSIEGLDLVFDVEITNPYAAALPLLGMEVALATNDRQFLKGSSDVSGSVPANAARTIPVRTAVNFAGLLKAVKSVKAGTVIPYRADLTLSVKVTGVGKVAVPLSKEGELPVPAVPSVSLRRIEWEKLTFEEARAVVHVELKNRNSFALQLVRMGYDLSLGGRRIADAKVERPASFDAGGAIALEIPVTLRPIDLGLGAFNILRGKDASYGIKGSLDVETPFGALAMPYRAEGKVPLIGG